MRRSVALAIALAGLLTGRTSRADDPHDLFGVGKHADAPPPTCDEIHTFGCAMVSDPFDPTPAFALSTWLPATYLRRLPVADATHDAVGTYGLGAGRDDTGPSFGGATGLENRWTIEGAPADSLRTGGPETRVPLSFLEGITITAGGFSAHDRTSTGGTIDATLRRGTATHELEATVWGGLTGENRLRPIASGSFFLRRLSAAAGPDLSAAIVGTGPLGTLLGGSAWYAAGIAPALASTTDTWRTGRLVDADGNGGIDGLPGQVVVEPVLVQTRQTTDWVVPAMVRTGFDRGPHHLELSLIGSGSNGTRFLSNATLQAAGIDRRDWIADGIATYRGTWKRTHVTVQLAWHRSVHRESAHDPAAANQLQLLTAYIPPTLPDEPQLAAICHDNTYPKIEQCAVPFGYFASGGAGPLVDLVADRPTATADVTHRLDDQHTLRAGATLEDSRIIQTSGFTGGELDRSLFDGHLDQVRYYHGSCEPVAHATCGYAAESQLAYRTRYTAAYVEDTYVPAEGIHADGGLRWELMWVGPKLHFSNELAPRGGLAWDFLGGGRSRLWTSYARTFAMLPAGTGPTLIRRDPTVHDAMSFADSRDVDPGATFTPVRGIEPMAQDELTAGIEVGLARTVRLTAWAQGRWLRRGLETTANGFDNPGRTDGLPARRSAEILAAEIATAPTGKLTLRIGYLVGKTIGNYLGPYDPRQGAILYNGDSFDGTGDAALTSANEMGRLPTDLGHRVYVEAERRGRLGSVGLALSTRLTLASGRVRNAFADTDVGVLSILERGSVGRDPMLSQANVHLAARWQGFDLTLDVFNVFDHKQAGVTDEMYTDAFVRPIEGGSYADLVFLRSTDGQTIGRRTAYGLPIAFQCPSSAVLGVHRSF